MEGFKVLNAKERSEVISQTQMLQASVYFKFLNTGVYKTHVLRSGTRRVITCKRPPALPLVLSNKQVTMNFVIDSELYFMNTFVTIDQRSIHFSAETDIFHLARRSNRRLRLPKDYEANLMIKRLCGQMAFLRGILLDLSPGGCRLALNTDVPLVTTDDTLEGTLKISGRPNVEVEGLVRYHKLYVRKEHKQIFGVEFKGLTKSATSRIQTIVTDLQREFFLKSLE